VKSRLVLPFWYWLTRVVPEKGPLNGCVRVCVGAGSARRLTGSEQGAVVTERQTVDELSVTMQVFEQHA